VPLAPGVRLDRYELLCPVAQGGMASVWVARLTGKHGFEKLFAVKAILPRFAHDVRFQKMFLDEARLASRIDHANVAHVLDLGEVNDVLYLVMEWVDGDSLSSLNRAAKKRGDPIPLGVLLRVLADTCAGLHAAHEVKGDDGELLGVVHRDVSPQNILVTTKGAAKLIDFGVAKARGRVAGETSSGQFKGKIHYMAPEQAVGQSVDRRADVWSVAAVAYSILAGAPPFDGPNELATLHLLTSGMPPPPLPSHVPAQVAEVILGALVADVDRRLPPTAHEMQIALERAMLETGHVASVADVAAFASIYLAGHSESRKRALDTALIAAAGRKADSSSGVGSSHASSSGVGASPPSSSGVSASPQGGMRAHTAIETPFEIDVAFESEENASVSSVASTALPETRASEMRWTAERPTSPLRWFVALGALLATGGLVAFLLRPKDLSHEAPPSAEVAPVPSTPVPSTSGPATAEAPPPPVTAPTPAAEASAVPTATTSARPVSTKAATATPQIARPPGHPRPSPSAPAPHSKADYGF
jgi:eukaryotic-like serine/threonine-protein kinase